jgi:hypothetical protein
VRAVARRRCGPAGASGLRVGSLPVWAGRATWGQMDVELVLLRHPWSSTYATSILAEQRSA